MLTYCFGSGGRLNDCRLFVIEITNVSPVVQCHITSAKHVGTAYNCDLPHLISIITLLNCSMAKHPPVTEIDIVLLAFRGPRMNC